MLRTVSLALVAVMVATTVTAADEPRKCTCDDIEDLRAALKMVKMTRAAWYSVLADLMGGSKSIKNGDDAKTAFAHYMGWDTANVVEIGKVSRTGDIKVDEQFQQKHCAAIIEGIKEHESAHFWYFSLRAIPIFMMSQRGLACVLARSEIDSRNVQARSLSRTIKALKKECGRSYSPDDSADPPPGGRIQDSKPF